MSKPRILVQLDTDPHPSTFDAVVAIDAGAEHLLQYAAVRPESVQSLVHGAMFTRAPADLKHTAIFIGGSDVQAGEALLQAVQKTFFGPLRVSVLMDSNGANTTAAAAVLAARRHVSLRGAAALVLGATGPVGQRVVRLLARQGAQVAAASRKLQRAQEVCQRIVGQVPGAAVQPLAIDAGGALQEALAQSAVLIAAGAAGVELLSADRWQRAGNLRVAIDLNAVPPVGLAGIDPRDKARQHEQVLVYGALGVGGTKMKIHRAAIEQLFQRNELVLDAEEVFELGTQLDQ